MTEPFDADKFVCKLKSFTQDASAWEKKLAQDAYERGRNDGLEEAVARLNDGLSTCEFAGQHAHMTISDAIHAILELKQDQK